MKFTRDAGVLLDKQSTIEVYPVFNFNNLIE